MRRALCVALAVLCAAVCCSHALDNGLGKTPAMGWNSWNKYHCNINETIFRNVVDAMVSTGMRDAGYEYVNLDDCVFSGRDAQGNLVPDAKAFPSGIKALSDYTHSKGLKFGIYTDAGTATCQGRPGIAGHEQQDANAYAAWGVDYLKVDWCHSEGMTPKDRYPKIRDALLASGRPIFYSMCEWGVDKPWAWAAPVANSWRTTGDIQPLWIRMVEIVDAMEGLGKYAGPGAWNDPDMLEIGNGNWTETEYQAHFSLWSVMNAPLIAGNDVTHMPDSVANILMNHEVIAVNQDPLGVAGDLRKKEGILYNKQMWSKAMYGNAHSVVLFNKGTFSEKFKFDFSLLDPKPAGRTFAVRDLWQHADLGTFTDSIELEVPSHGVRHLKLSPAGDLTDNVSAM